MKKPINATFLALDEAAIEAGTRYGIHSYNRNMRNLFHSFKQEAACLTGTAG
jgi:hypothetical protein